jgi:hypothetical protein
MDGGGHGPATESRLLWYCSMEDLSGGRAEKVEMGVGLRQNFPPSVQAEVADAAKTVENFIGRRQLRELRELRELAPNLAPAGS